MLTARVPTPTAAPIEAPEPRPLATTLDPDPATTDTLLDQFISPQSSLASIAAVHGVTITALTLWMTRPDVADRLDTLASAAASHTRLAATHHLPCAVGALVGTSCEYTDRHADPHDQGEPMQSFPRRAESARRACALLFRLARYYPGAPRSVVTLRAAEPSAQSPQPASPRPRPSPDQVAEFVRALSALPAPGPSAPGPESKSAHAPATADDLVRPSVPNEPTAPTVPGSQAPVRPPSAENPPCDPAAATSDAEFQADMAELTSILRAEPALAAAIASGCEGLQHTGTPPHDHADDSARRRFKVRRRSSG
jgi:hypothetical protein